MQSMPSQMSNLTRHQTHTGEKHKCEHSPKTFCKSSDLSNHIQTRTGEKYFKCHQCPKLFNKMSDLTRHHHIHTGKKLYKCLDCPKTFSRMSSLTRHHHTYTGEKPFKCNKYRKKTCKCQMSTWTS